jgi:hypothetical protein
MTDAVVTSVKAEIFHGGNPEPKITAVRAEVFHGGTAKQKVTAVRAEVFHSIANLVVLAHRRITVVVTSV